MILDNTRTPLLTSPYEQRPNERGVALATTLIVIALMAVISVSVLAVVSNEASIAGGDLQRTQTYDAAAAGIEKMTSDFSAVFERKSKPSTTDLTTIQGAYPTELTADGFSFNQTIVENATALAAMRAAQGITNNTTYPRVTIPTGPFAGLIATLSPYQLTTTAIHTAGNTQVTLQRDMNNYLIPLFQFGMFSDGDIEVHPGAPFFFNGRIHANGNIYATGIATFLDKVTVGNELVRTVLRNGNNFTDSGNVNVQVGGILVPMTVGSVTGGPNLPGKTAGQRGFFPDSPNGTDNSTWVTNSVAAAQTGVANQFGGQVLTRMTGAVPLYLPLQLGGNPTREIIKRQMPGENDPSAANYDQVLNDSRYHSKAQIRILLDDEGQTQAGNKAAIPDNKGVELSQTVATNAYYFKPKPLGGGRALWRVGDNGAYIDTATTAPLQCPDSTSSCSSPADTVRGVKSSSAPAEFSYNNAAIRIPAGAGIKGRILIEIVPPNGGAPIDVTRDILSMGMTEGEPNAIVQLQRPLWAAFTQGSRDRNGNNDYLTYIINNTSIGADGQIKVSSSVPLAPVMDATYGFLTSIQDDSTGQPRRLNAPALSSDVFPARWNSIVPINVYNVREGWIRGNLTNTTVYERGVTSIVELNMRNLARWADGVYDTNLLAGTNAVSTNIDGVSANGYIVYVSDRRGDKVKSEYASYNETTGAPVGAAIQTTNGMADNEDIYGPNNILDGIALPDGTLASGEDVIDFGVDPVTGKAKKGSLQKDTTELPDPAALATLAPPSPLPASFTNTTRFTNALTVAAYPTSTYFRRAVRLFNGEDLLTQTAANKLSSTKGLTVSTENMVYIWGNYNTTGITCQPGGATPTGSTLNDPTKPCTYTGDQVPASIVGDAFFPLSKTWFDASSALFPESSGMRPADVGAAADGTQSTSVRAGIIAGNTLSAMAGTPDADNGNESRLSGGMHNFPRFSETWSNRWNFVGALAPLYRSTQALAPYHTGNGEIYGAPKRNWAFDDSFRDPNRLPPGTPTFQYIEPTGFRQLLN